MFAWNTMERRNYQKPSQVMHDLGLGPLLAGGGVFYLWQIRRVTGLGMDTAGRNPSRDSGHHPVAGILLKVGERWLGCAGSNASENACQILEPLLQGLGGASVKQWRSSVVFQNRSRPQRSAHLSKGCPARAAKRLRLRLVPHIAGLAHQ